MAVYWRLESAKTYMPNMPLKNPKMVKDKALDSSKGASTAVRRRHPTNLSSAK